MANADCPLGPRDSRPTSDYVVTGFVPYEIELDNPGGINISPLVAKIADLIKKKAFFNKLEIIGHAAKYGRSEFLATSRSRAYVVEAGSFTHLLTYPDKCNRKRKGCGLNAANRICRANDLGKATEFVVWDWRPGNPLH